MESTVQSTFSTQCLTMSQRWHKGSQIANSMKIPSNFKFLQLIEPKDFILWVNMLF